jgi:DNA-binding beta-propeller fold protein YncE
MEKRLLAGLVLALLLISGCSRARNSGSLGGSRIGSTAGQLYVSTNSAILRFSGALTATGNIAPTASITGSATLLSSPEHLIVDPSADRLYVANQGSSSILVFDSASHTTGNAAPPRTISGASTLLAAPHDLALDAGNNLLYVADGTQILVFQSASTINGNVPPVHNISMGFAVGAILVDVANNRLYVADTSGNAISRLEGASLQDGPAVFAATISGAATGLARPQGLALDSTGRLIVSNAAGPSITIYASAASASGNVAPVATISGAATQLAGPDQIVLNQGQNNGELYVADNLAGAIFIFTNVISASGNLAPARSIAGAATGLVPNGVNGVALDTTR